MCLSSDPLLMLLQSEASVFTRPTFGHVLLLVCGTLLTSGRRTVTAALRAVGRGEERHFTTYHRVLNRAVWSPFSLSRILLKLLAKTFLAPNAPLILLIDGTLERRWGKRIAYKGRFHDAVRSASGHVQTSEGIHWLCVMLLVRIPWCQRPWALPVLSVPTLTPATSAKLGKRHRTTAQAAQILIALIRRWYPEREIVLIGDGGFAATSLGHTCRRLQVRFVSRLLLTAQLYDPVPPQPKGKPGVKPKKGPRQAKLTQRVTNRATAWFSQEIAWYAGQQLKMDLLDGTALWHRDGEDPLPLRLSSSCAIQVASALPLPSFARTPPLPCCKSSLGTSVAGTSRSPLKRRVPISGSAPSGSGVLQLSPAPLRACWGCSA